jgi:uncharacterized protein Yka (UPF0111/DUF47 family)
MPKKQGLGRDINNSLETMDSTLSCLAEFSRMPLKRGLVSNKIKDEDLLKEVNKTAETAFTLMNMIEDLKGKISSVKVGGNSRFAKQVIARFLSGE